MSTSATCESRPFFTLFSLILTVLLAFLCIITGDARAQDLPINPLPAEVRLRFANFPSASTFPCVAMEEWAKEISKRTNGRAAIETFPGGTLLDAKNMVRGVTMGQADIGCISLAYHPGAYPFLSVFELPLGLVSAEQASAVLWDLHEANLPAETSRIKVIALYTSPPSQIFSSREMNGLADFSGQTLRTSGIQADVAQLLGASPISMPQSDTPEALQKGVVQGVITSPDVLKDYNFAESCRYGLNVNMGMYPFMVFMNQRKWDSLPTDIQQVILDMSREHSIWTGKYVDNHATEALEWSAQTYGFQYLNPGDQVRQELRDKAQPVIEAWIKQAADSGLDGQDILLQIQNLSEKSQ